MIRYDVIHGFFRGLTKDVGEYATSRKVAGSIPDEVIGFFN
jgi:hypothetical protein